jgi:thioredoxin-related protein
MDNINRKLGSMVGAVPLLLEAEADARAASKLRVPLIVLFSLSDCGFCHEVRRNYLASLIRELGDGVVIREVVSDEPHKLTWFGGEQLTHPQLAARTHIQFYPTLHFFDAQFKPLVEPLLGSNAAGFYNAYLDQRIAQSTQILRRAKTIS